MTEKNECRRDSCLYHARICEEYGTCMIFKEVAYEACDKYERRDSKGWFEIHDPCVGCPRKGLCRTDKKRLCDKTADRSPKEEKIYSAIKGTVSAVELSVLLSIDIESIKETIEALEEKKMVKVRHIKNKDGTLKMIITRGNKNV